MILADLVSNIITNVLTKGDVKKTGRILSFITLGNMGILIISVFSYLLSPITKSYLLDKYLIFIFIICIILLLFILHELATLIEHEVSKNFSESLKEERITKLMKSIIFCDNLIKACIDTYAICLGVFYVFCYSLLLGSLYFLALYTFYKIGILSSVYLLNYYNCMLLSVFIVFASLVLTIFFQDTNIVQPHLLEFIPFIINMPSRIFNIRFNVSNIFSGIIVYIYLIFIPFVQVILNILKINHNIIESNDLMAYKNKLENILREIPGFEVINIPLNEKDTDKKNIFALGVKKNNKGVAIVLGVLYNNRIHVFTIFLANKFLYEYFLHVNYSNSNDITRRTLKCSDILHNLLYDLNTLLDKYYKRYQKIQGFKKRRTRSISKGIRRRRNFL